MIPLLLLLQAATATPAADGSPLDPIARQQLPDTGCAAYLWSVGARHDLVAMASADAGRLRLSIDGKPVDLLRNGQSGGGQMGGGQAGAAGFGFAGTTLYRAGDVSATLDLTIAADASLTQGATVPGATVTLDRPGRDSVVVPVAGLIGCAAPSPTR